MERARLALKYFARPLSNSNIGSESLKIRNMCRLLLHYTTPTFIRALILHPRLSALLKAHTFQFLILLFLPVRFRNLLTYNNEQAHFHIDSSPPPRSWSQAQVGLSYQFSSNCLDLPCFARSACPLLHRHPLFLRLSLMIIEHNHQWCLHKYCTFFFVL